MTTERIIIFDTTLRDGEQSPGASMNLDEKLRIAAMLENMGVDVIEAGFPMASNGDFEAVNEIAKASSKSIICGLCRAKESDIKRCAEAIKPAARNRIHTFISTSPLHMKYKLQMEPDAVIEAIKASVSYARNFTDDVEWSAEDASRTEMDFLCKAVETAIAAGATTINLPDTVGYAIPNEYAKLISTVINTVPNSDKAIFSVHCHNDLGLGVANSLAAIEAGARQVECTINGLGERAGNAAMEEIVMALRTRGDSYKYDTGIDSKFITRASHLVSFVTGFTVQPNKAIVGANAFAHESGIHQDGMLKHAETYEIMTPESVGLAKSDMVLGKHSGRHAFKTKLEELGYGNLEEGAIEKAFAAFKDLADKKKEVFDEDIVSILDGEMSAREDRIKLVSLDVHCGTFAPKVKIVLEIDGEEKAAETSGDGPVDATFGAIKELFPEIQTRLLLYRVNAVTEGTDAQAGVTVRLKDLGGDGKTINGNGANTDTLVASAEAYINALNNLLEFSNRKK